ncbi:uncharacterized protein pdzph1 isoform X2 [Hemitrygon akajei]
MIPARKNTIPPLENGAALSFEESSDNDRRKHCRGPSRSKMEPDALDYKVDKTEDKITFQALIKQALAEKVSVTIELSPELIESTRITLQLQLPWCKTEAGDSKWEATDKSSCVKVEFKTVSFAGDGSMFMPGNKEKECSQCQQYDVPSSYPAALNNWKLDQQSDQSSWLKLRMTMNDNSLKVPGENDVSCGNNIPIPEAKSYEKFSYEGKHNNEELLYPKDQTSSKGHYSPHIHSQTGDCLLIDCALNIPPPDEFADGCQEVKPLSKTQETVHLIQEKCDGESDVSAERYQRDRNKMVGSPGYQCSSEDVNQAYTMMDKWGRLPKCSYRVQASESLGKISTRNDLGKDKNSFRNSSINNIDRIMAQNYCQVQPATRRKTYPYSDGIDVNLQVEWKGDINLLHQNQLHSSHTLPPFYTQTLPRKQGKPERVSGEDIRGFLCFQGYTTSGKSICKDSCDGSRLSCWSSSGTLSPLKSPEIYSEVQGRDSQSPLSFHSEESANDVFHPNPSTRSESEDRNEIFRTDLCQHQNTLPEEGMKDISKRDMNSWQTAEPQEQGDFTESGFETLDSDYPSEIVEDMTPISEQFQIQITPPSPSDHVANNGHTTADVFDTISNLDSGNRTKNGDKNTEFKKRRHSVTILQTGALDQRLIIQNNHRKIENVDASRHSSTFGECDEEDDVDLYESNGAGRFDVGHESASSDTAGDTHALLATECSSQVSLITLRDDCEQNHKKPNSSASDEDDDKLHCKTITFAIQQNNKQHSNAEYSTQQSENTQKLTEGYETLKKNMNEANKSLLLTSTKANCPFEDTQPLNYTAPSEKQKMEIICQKSLHKEKWDQDLKAEPSCLLQLPSDTVQRDGKASESCPVLPPTREASEHWAKRRKQFKESKQYSSTGGSSGTSNQGSVNSEETRSMDLAQMRGDNEQRGFYSETYNSISWIFRGDEGNPGNNSRCLGKRVHPAAIRERTVKIAKGTGDYPWGFRIQFSKPILVTEVDTNGAAEEAGLQIGDIVLAVNGTDVTSIPHSEAATLARQGPDTLTLVVGSDIGRCPNTPRPACRGYLHKRTHSGLLKGWRKRWFVLKHNGLFYYYKNKMDEGRCRPLDVMKLEGAEISVDTSLGKPFVFKCFLQSKSKMFYFCSTSNQEMKRWLEAMERAIHPVHQSHVWVDVIHHNANLPPLAIKSPECLGLLHQVDRNKNVWAQHYCVLKDACLYFYAGIRSTHALGGIYLQGYVVSEQGLGSKRTIIEAKPPSEEFKTFYLCADNSADNQRWIMALRASISKWLPLHQAIHDFMSNPPEETRM